MSKVPLHHATTTVPPITVPLYQAPTTVPKTRWALGRMRDAPVYSVVNVEEELVVGAGSLAEVLGHRLEPCHLRLQTRNKTPVQYF